MIFYNIIKKTLRYNNLDDHLKNTDTKNGRQLIRNQGARWPLEV